MKHFFVILLFCVSVFAVNAQSKAQSGADFKVAYFDRDSLLKIMPDYKAAADKAQQFYQNLEKQISDMNMSQQLLVEEIATKDFTPQAKAIKEKELTALQNDIAAFKVTAQEEYKAYNERMLAPMIEKINAAAKKVAREKGYAYVLDGSKSAGIIIFANESYNIFDDMCKELGIPVPKKQ